MKKVMRASDDEGNAGSTFNRQLSEKDGKSHMNILQLIKEMQDQLSTVKYQKRLTNVMRAFF